MGKKLKKGKKWDLLFVCVESGVETLPTYRVVTPWLKYALIMAYYNCYLWLKCSLTSGRRSTVWAVSAKAERSALCGPREYTTVAIITTPTVFEKFEVATQTSALWHSGRRWWRERRRSNGCRCRQCACGCRTSDLSTRKPAETANSCRAIDEQ